MHRQINGGTSQTENEFQFYPGKESTKSKTVKQRSNAHPGNEGGLQIDGGLGMKQDSVMTVAVDGN